MRATSAPACKRKRGMAARYRTPDAVMTETAVVHAINAH
jgi:hypothetical protein